MIYTIIFIIFDSSILFALLLRKVSYSFISIVFEVSILSVWTLFIFIVVGCVSVVSGFRLIFGLGSIFGISCFSRTSSFSSPSYLHAILTHSRTDHLACLLAITQFSSYSLCAKAAISICLHNSSIACSIIFNAISIISISQKEFSIFAHCFLCNLHLLFTITSIFALIFPSEHYIEI